MAPMASNRWLGVMGLCIALAASAAPAALRAQTRSAEVSADVSAEVSAGAASAPARVERFDWNWKEALGVATALIALLGTAVPLVAKSLEAYSASARSRRQLQRIQELADLMGKIKKDNLLNPQAMEAVSTQVHAEVDTALAELQRYREGRAKDALARQTQKERRAQSGMPFWRRALLLYMPNDVMAWIAHPIVYLYSAAAIAGVVEADTDLVLGSLVFVGGAWLVAWHARRRWERAQALLGASASAGA
jgi:hypothetical protein